MHFLFNNFSIPNRADLIAHASGQSSKPIVAGFFLYYIVNQDRKSTEYTAPLGDYDAFENEWMEVEIPLPGGGGGPSSSSVVDCGDCTASNSMACEANVPKFLHETVETEFNEGPLYKQCHMEIDAGQKSDRIEWGHVRYHKRMRPGHAFEIVVQWLTASGPIVHDLVNGWMRKALQCGYQLVSVPADPLAEPFTDKSDPLRGPIFVPLNLNCLEKDGQNIFKGKCVFVK